MHYLILISFLAFTIPFVTSISIPKAIKTKAKTQPKFCVDCKHFMPSSDSSTEYGKCSMFPMFPTGTSNPKFLVTGNPGIAESYYFCTTARTSSDLCGQSAKKYKKIRKNAKNIKI